MLDLQPSSFEKFEREARQGNVVPVVRSVLADLQTPVGAFMRIARNSQYAFLLESVEGGERIARYSFLGAEPESCPVVASASIRRYLREYVLSQRSGLVPVVGRAGRYFGYAGVQWLAPG